MEKLPSPSGEETEGNLLKHLAHETRVLKEIPTVREALNERQTRILASSFPSVCPGLLSDLLKQCFYLGRGNVNIQVRGVIRQRTALLQILS